MPESINGDSSAIPGHNLVAKGGEAILYKGSSSALYRIRCNSSPAVSVAVDGRPLSTRLNTGDAVDVRGQEIRVLNYLSSGSGDIYYDWISADTQSDSDKISGSLILKPATEKEIYKGPTPANYRIGNVHGELGYYALQIRRDNESTLTTTLFPNDTVDVHAIRIRVSNASAKTLEVRYQRIG